MEELEARNLPSVSWPGFTNAVEEAGTNATLDQAQALPSLGTNSRVEVVGSIAAGRADVDYYQFTLSGDATVHLQTADQGNSPLVSVLTLYKDDGTDPFIQPLAQDDGASRGGDAVIDVVLSQGTYAVAVSGSGNRFFHPYIADSGYVGSTGTYGLVISTAAPSLPSTPFEWIPGEDEPDNTLDTAHQLPDLRGGNLVQVTGIIGNDPTAADDGFDPVNDVDIYHFEITGPGHYAFAAEVFAGRINSTLDPALSLFRREEDGTVVVVAANMNNNNTQEMSIPGAPPLLLDSALFAGLPSGSYYLAVSSGFNVADPNADPSWPNPDIFDPNVAHTGDFGNSTGPYVLNVKLGEDPGPPHVVSTSLSEGVVLPGPPTQLVVQFDAPMDLQQIAARAYETTGASTVAPVYIIGSDGNPVFPRFLSFDPATNSATFQLIDAVPGGPAELHLAGGHPDGPPALTDLAGNPIVGNDPSGDYVVHFTVGGPQRGTPASDGMLADSRAWIGGQAITDRDHPQVLGMLFPMELQGTGVTITRSTFPSADESGDYYQIEVEQTQDYIIILTGGEGSTVRLWQGSTEDATINPQPGIFIAHLYPGRYVVGVEWSDQSSAGPYTLTVLLQSFEQATSLTTGPAPALQMRLVSDPPQPPSPAGGIPVPPQPPPPAGGIPVPPAEKEPVSPAGLSTPGTPSHPNNTPMITALPHGTFLSLSDRPLGSSPGIASVTRLFLSETLVKQNANLFQVNPFVLAAITNPTFFLEGSEDGESPVPNLALNEYFQAFGKVQGITHSALEGTVTGLGQTGLVLADVVQGCTKALDNLFATWPTQQADPSGLVSAPQPLGDKFAPPPVATVAVPAGGDETAVAALAGSGEGSWFSLPVLEAGILAVGLTFALARARSWCGCHRTKLSAEGESVPRNVTSSRFFPNRHGSTCP